MLSGNFTVGALGSGRIRLPLEFVELNSISYAQPIVVVYEQQSGKPLAAVEAAERQYSNTSLATTHSLCRRTSKILVHCISSSGQRELQWLV